jgi:hypothetical protein
VTGSSAAGGGGSGGSSATAGMGGSTTSAGAGGSVINPGPIDAVIAAMPPDSWKALPGTAMKDVCPLPYSSYYCWAVLGAWSGAAYDAARERMLVFGGGHADSYYNNLFSFDLVEMKWQRLTEMPAGADGQTPTPWMKDIRVETCGYYPKGPLTLPDSVMAGAYVAHDKCFVEPVLSQLDLQQPRSTHSYGKLVVLPTKDRFCWLGGGTYPSAQAMTEYPVCFDFATGTWSRFTHKVPLGSVARGVSATTADGHLWYLTDSGGEIVEYDPAADAWTKHGYIDYKVDGFGDIDRQRSHFYILRHPASGYELRRWDLTSPTELKAGTYTTVAASGDVPADVGGRPGVVYADARDRFYVWGGNRDIYSFDPKTQAWKHFAAGGDDPGPQLANGTFGRFRYSPSRDVFVLVNDTTKDVLIYKPAS